MGRSVALNLSNLPVFYKDETDVPDTEQAPKQIKKWTRGKKIDGVNVNGNVYKLVDSTHIVILPNGKILNVGLLSIFGNRFIGGGYLETPPDVTWKPLFNVVKK